jgi:hypothetical protein
MKKRGCIFFAIFAIIFVFPFIFAENNTITGNAITGEAVTGKATDANLAMSVVLALELPVLEMFSPKNNTYITPYNLLLNYSALYINTVWYNLNNGINYTLNSPLLFNSSEGSHTVFLYANNTDGAVSSINRSFSINSSKLTILYSKYSWYDKGDSTDFNKSSYEELQNLSNIILERTFGKIQFHESINLTDDENFSDNIVDLDKNTNITSNRIYINSTALSNFNKPATLYLYGLTFTDPIILKNGAVCPSTVCTKESYAGGTLKFNVTEFSLYSANETPSTTVVTTSSSGSGGGSGGGIISIIVPKVKSFEFNTDEIKVSSTPGRVVTKKINITNIINKTIILTLSEEKLSKFILFKENPISLNPGESKEISFDFIISSDVIPDLYLGKLIATDADGYSSEAIILIEIESEGALLDVSTKIQPEYKNIKPGEQILAEVSLFNVGTITGKRDILLEYFVKKDDEKIILQYNETISIETQTNLVKRFDIPSGTSYGKYIFYVKAITDDGKIASGSDTFRVVNPLAGLYFLIAVLVAFLIILILFMIYLLFRKKRHHHEEIKGIKPLLSESHEINYPQRILIPADIKDEFEKQKRKDELSNLKERMLTVSKVKKKATSKKNKKKSKR